jgi:hypothetical protein
LYSLARKIITNPFAGNVIPIRKQGLKTDKGRGDMARGDMARGDKANFSLPSSNSGLPTSDFRLRSSSLLTPITA